MQGFCIVAFMLFAPLSLSAEITCPIIDTLENGQVFGGTYYVGDTVTFQCNSDNFVMYGSVNRTCLENWRWTGTTTTCDDGSKSVSCQILMHLPKP